MGDNLSGNLCILLNLEKSVESRKSAQLIDLYSYMKKVLITNKVTLHFFITLPKSINAHLFLAQLINPG